MSVPTKSAELLGDLLDEKFKALGFREGIRSALACGVTKDELLAAFETASTVPAESGDRRTRELEAAVVVLRSDLESKSLRLRAALTLLKYDLRGEDRERSETRKTSGGRAAQ